MFKPCSSSIKMVSRFLWRKFKKFQTWSSTGHSTPHHKKWISLIWYEICMKITVWKLHSKESITIQKNVWNQKNRLQSKKQYFWFLLNYPASTQLEHRSGYKRHGPSVHALCVTRAGYKAHLHGMPVGRHGKSNPEMTMLNIQAMLNQQLQDFSCNQALKEWAETRQEVRFISFNYSYYNSSFNQHNWIAQSEHEWWY